MIKKSVYVLTLSKVFPHDHPKKGLPTTFKEQLLSQVKLHTMRGNYHLWKNRIDKINEGKAVLSIRQWSGQPYRSKNGIKQEIARYSRIGYQEVEISYAGVPGIGEKIKIYIDEKQLSADAIDRLIKNDGFYRNKHDFFNWFIKDFNGILIHFTDFRY